MQRMLHLAVLVPITILLLVQWTACNDAAPQEPYSITGSGDTLWGPGAYNDYLVSKQEAIILRIVDLGSSFQEFDSVAIEEAYRNLKTQVDHSLEAVNGLQPLEQDSILRPAILRLFAFYKELVDQEYGAIKDIVQQGQGNITYSDKAVIDSLTQQMAEEEVAVDSLFKDAQKRFAEAYNMQIVESDFQPIADTTSNP